MYGNGGEKSQGRSLSRVGRKPIPVPKNVKVELQPGQVVIQGPKGGITQPYHPAMEVKLEDGAILVLAPTSSHLHRALHGLTRSLIANAVAGVTQGYRRSLELMGIGYRVQQASENLILTVGLSHPVEVKPLPGVKLIAEGANRIHVEGIDKQKVGEMAALIRRVRPPNPYKEKGIRYAEERIKLKPGKAAARKAQ